MLAQHLQHPAGLLLCSFPFCGHKNAPESQSLPGRSQPPSAAPWAAQRRGPAFPKQAPGLLYKTQTPNLGKLVPALAVQMGSLHVPTAWSLQVQLCSKDRFQLVCPRPEGPRQSGLCSTKSRGMPVPASWVRAARRSLCLMLGARFPFPGLWSPPLLPPTGPRPFPVAHHSTGTELACICSGIEGMGPLI